jgi:hypothetical protein
MLCARAFTATLELEHLFSIIKCVGVLLSPIVASFTLNRCQNLRRLLRGESRRWFLSATFDETHRVHGRRFAARQAFDFNPRTYLQKGSALMRYPSVGGKWPIVM